MSNIPDDGYWIYKTNTLTESEKLKRWIQRKKFYATLPHKIDNSIEEFKAATPEPDPELEWEFQETNEFGQEGWTISYTHKSMKKDA